MKAINEPMSATERSHRAIACHLPMAIQSLQLSIACHIQEAVDEAVKQAREECMEIAKNVYHYEPDPWKHSVLIEEKIRALK